MHDASSIKFIPTTEIAQTDVQSALAWVGTRIFVPGSPAPIPGTTGRVDFALEKIPGRVGHELALYPQNAYTRFAFSERIDSSYTGKSAVCSTMALVLENDGSPNAGVPLWLVGNARTSNTEVFGANIIVRSEAHLTNTKLIGLEIDIQPAVSSPTAEGSAGIYLNAFGTLVNGCAFQIGALPGASFKNGIAIGGISSDGAGVSGVTGFDMGSLINSGGARYNEAAIVLSNGHKLFLKGTGPTSGALLFCNETNDTVLIGSIGTPLVIKDNSNSHNILTFSSSGVIDLPNGGALKISGTQVVSRRDMGWGTMTGRSDKHSNYDTDRVSLQGLAARVKALQDTLTMHGLIGA